MRTPRLRSRWSAGRVARRAVYAAYMNSKAWQDKRRAWYARWVTLTGTSPVCLVCGRRWSVRSGHLHHLTYQRLGAEEPTDLMPLCKLCGIPHNLHYADRLIMPTDVWVALPCMRSPPVRVGITRGLGSRLVL